MNILEGKKQMAINVGTETFTFDLDIENKRMKCTLDPIYHILVTFKIASFDVELFKFKELSQITETPQPQNERLDYAIITFPVLTNDVDAFLSGRTKVTQGHIVAVPQLGAVIKHFFDVYQFKKNENK